MLDHDTAAKAAEALMMAIVALFEEALDAGVQSASTLGDYAERAATLRKLADDALVVTAALQALAQRGQRSTP